MQPSGRWLGLVAGGVLILYPLLVYVGLDYLGPRWLAVILLVVVGARLLLVKVLGVGVAQSHNLWLLLAAVIATLVTLASGSSIGLKFYPVLVSLVLLMVFGLSLWRPPTVIERFARLQHADLPSYAIAYTRKVTWVWCGFFVANGAIAFATVYASDELWALYNGLLSYLAIVILLVGEYPLRKWVEYKHKANSRLEP